MDQQRDALLARRLAQIYSIPTNTPSQSTAKGSQKMRAHNGESYLKWASRHSLEPTAWYQPPWEWESLRNRVDSQSPKNLFSCLEAEGLCCLNGYETSGTRPIYFLFSALTPPGFLYSSAQNIFGLWLLISQCYNLASTAPVQSFLLVLVTENRGAHSCFMFAHWKSNFLGPHFLFPVNSMT